MAELTHVLQQGHEAVIMMTQEYQDYAGAPHRTQHLELRMDEDTLRDHIRKLKIVLEDICFDKNLREAFEVLDTLEADHDFWENKYGFTKPVFAKWSDFGCDYQQFKEMVLAQHSRDFTLLLIKAPDMVSSEIFKLKGTEICP